jgi:hypothetical protein
MTVTELIEKLKEYDDSSIVLGRDSISPHHNKAYRVHGVDRRNAKHTEHTEFVTGYQEMTLEMIKEGIREERVMPDAEGVVPAVVLVF